MRVLWISGVCPLPLTDGHRQRVFHLLRSVARRHETTLLCQVRAADTPHLSELEDLCHRVLPVPQPEGDRDRAAARLARRLRGTLTGSPTCFLPAALPAMQRALAEEVRGELDLAIGGLYGAPLVLAAPARRRVIDDQNVEGELYHQLWRSETPGPRRVSRWLDWIAVDGFERRMLPRVDRVTVCSERDRAVLEDRVRGLPPAAVIPNGVDLSRPPREPGLPAEESLVFTGSMAYAPNVEAAEYLVRAIMPNVWKGRPGVRVLLVGKDPHPRVKALAGERVRVTGAVPETRPYLERASLAVVPLRSGGGTRLKLLEAMAAGVPVVSTPRGAEGIELTPGHEIEIADGPEAFAAGVLKLLEAPERAAAMSRAARKRVESAYGWEATGEKLVETLEQCESDRAGRTGEVLRAPG